MPSIDDQKIIFRKRRKYKQNFKKRQRFSPFLPEEQKKTLLLVVFMFPKLSKSVGNLRWVVLLKC